MRQKMSGIITGVMVVIVVPFIMTMIMNGRKEDVESRLESLDTGKDVLISIEDENKLIDVEQYVAAVLPGEVEPGLSREMLEAQAVAVRTKIYFAMGDKSVIEATELTYRYYDDSAYIERWGQDNYRRIKRLYEEAVINTAGQIIK